MNTVTIALASYGTDLSSRANGVVVRDALLAALAHGSLRVTVDCTGIRTLSESFADEVFGLLVAEYGKPWFKEHVAVLGLTDSTRVSILRAVAERLHLSPAA